jgi:hypothetical protein
MCLRLAWSSISFASFAWWAYGKKRLNCQKCPEKHPCQQIEANPNIVQRKSRIVFVLMEYLADCARYTCGENYQKIHRNDQQTDLLPLAEDRFAGNDIPIEPAFIQIRVRKHDVALAIDDVALPILQAHGGK